MSFLNKYYSKFIVIEKIDRETITNNQIEISHYFIINIVIFNHFIKNKYLHHLFVILLCILNLNNSLLAFLFWCFVVSRFYNEFIDLPIFYWPLSIVLQSECKLFELSNLFIFIRQSCAFPAYHIDKSFRSQSILNLVILGLSIRTVRIILLIRVFVSILYD